MYINIKMQRQQTQPTTWKKTSRTCTSRITQQKNPYRNICIVWTAALLNIYAIRPLIARAAALQDAREGYNIISVDARGLGKCICMRQVVHFQWMYPRVWCSPSGTWFVMRVFSVRWPYGAESQRHGSAVKRAYSAEQLLGARCLVFLGVCLTQSYSTIMTPKMGCSDAIKLWCVAHRYRRTCVMPTYILVHLGCATIYPHFRTPSRKASCHPDAP